MMRSRWGSKPVAFAAISVGAAAVVIGATGLVRDHPTPASFGTSTQATAAPQSGSIAASDQGGSETASPATGAASPGPGQLPAELALPTLNVRAPVDDVLATDGVLNVPENPDTVGWWTGSALPGSSTGTVVIDGHVDSAVTGIGALFRLTELAVDDPVRLTTATGRTLNYRIYARRVFAKHQGLPADIFAQTGPARLILITCGGPFDHATHNYLDNIVVYAAPTT